MDAVTNYVEAERAFEALNTRLNQAGEYLDRAAGALIENRAILMLSNCGSCSLPAEVVMRPHVSLNADEWPSPDQVGALLTEWHKARSKMRDAWHGMPKEISGKMTTPEWLK